MQANASQSLTREPINQTIPAQKKDRKRDLSKVIEPTGNLNVVQQQ
jgi:hypothetical protein